MYVYMGEAWMDSYDQRSIILAQKLRLVPFVERHRNPCKI